MPELSSAARAYNLRSLDLPKLKGRALRWLAGALEIQPSRAAILPNLLRQGGLDGLRQWRLDEAPAMFAAPAFEGDAVVSSTPAFTARPPGPFVSALEIGDAYREGRITPLEIAERCLTFIAAEREAVQPLGAFISVDRDDVLAQAQASAERFARGEPLSSLDGVPIAIKDEVDQTAYPTTVGTSFLGHQPARRDATVVARLRAAGAMLIGKTNMHEIGINPNGLNVHHGVARNPYDRTRDTGGSSSGSAAAVGAGLCPVSIGADGGGSIRIPAAHCGLVGLKPTFGRVSEHGAAPLTWSMGHLGPIGASVSDCVAVYAAIAGVDSHDPHTLAQSPVDVAGWDLGHLNGVRLGVFRPWFEHAEEDIVAANAGMLDALERAGATVSEVEIPELDEMRVAHAVTILSEMAASMEKHRAQRRSHGAGVRINLAIGRACTATDYLAAQRMKTRALAIFGGVLNTVDAIVTPSTAAAAPAIPKGALPHGWSDLSTETEVMRYVFPGNLIGLPAISFPVGYNRAGLPIGMQAMASHWQESLLLRIAHTAESCFERRTPPGYVNLLEGCGKDG